MGKGYIVRRGGGASERTITPNINFVSKTEAQIVVTFTNNDAAEADVFYGLTSPLTDKVTLATATTSSNVTFSGLDPDTSYTISAYAIVTNATLKKIKSEIVSTQITTDEINYTAATGGTTAEYDDAGKRYKSHTFLSNGTFEVTTVGDATGDRNKVDYLIIAGGGSGGHNRSGGGGAGGYLTTVTPTPGGTAVKTKPTVTVQSYTISIGGGGTGNTSGGNNGGTSSAFGETATGGGQGGSRISGLFNGTAGGSGGGGNGRENGSGGTGTTGQGRNGGTSALESTGGGGGGAGAVGNNGTARPGSSPGGNGGAGLANNLRTGSNETRAGGGGGGIEGTIPGVGGAGGGGNGGTYPSNPGAGAINTGGGGGGNGDASGGNGGSGIVIIRYEIAPV